MFLSISTVNISATAQFFYPICRNLRHILSSNSGSPLQAIKWDRYSSLIHRFVLKTRTAFIFFKEKVYLLRIIFYAVLHLYNLGTQPTFFRLKLFAQIPNIQFQQVVRKLDETVNWKKFSREQFRNSADGVERQHMILGIKSTDLTQVILAVSSKFSAFPLPGLSLTFFLLFLFLQRSETRWVAELILPPLQWTLISPDGRLFSTSLLSM